MKPYLIFLFLFFFQNTQAQELTKSLRLGFTKNTTPNFLNEAVGYHAQLEWQIKKRFACSFGLGQSWSENRYRVLRGGASGQLDSNREIERLFYTDFNLAFYSFKKKSRYQLKPGIGVTLLSISSDLSSGTNQSEFGSDKSEYALLNFLLENELSISKRLILNFTLILKKGVEIEIPSLVIGGGYRF